MTEKKTYKIVNHELNLILQVRGLDLSKERSLYNTIKQRISQADEPVNVGEYKEFLVRKLIVDGDAFVDDFMEKDGDIEILDSVYESIITLYPPFALDFVCS